MPRHSRLSNEQRATVAVFLVIVLGTFLLGFIAGSIGMLSPEVDELDHDLF